MKFVKFHFVQFSKSIKMENGLKNFYFKMIIESWKLDETI